MSKKMNPKNVRTMSIGVALVIVALMILVTVMEGEENVVGMGIFGPDEVIGGYEVEGRSGTNYVKISGVTFKEVNPVGGTRYWEEIGATDGKRWTINNDGSLTMTGANGRLYLVLPEDLTTTQDNWIEFVEGAEISSDGYITGTGDKITAKVNDQNGILFTTTDSSGNLLLEQYVPHGSGIAVDPQDNFEFGGIKMYVVDKDTIVSDGGTVYVYDRDGDETWHRQGSLNSAFSQEGDALFSNAVDDKLDEIEQRVGAPIFSPGSAADDEETAESAPQEPGEPAAAVTPEPAAAAPIEADPEPVGVAVEGEGFVFPDHCTQSNNCVKYKRTEYFADTDGQIYFKNKDGAARRLETSIPAGTQLRQISTFKQEGDADGDKDIWTNILTVSQDGQSVVVVGQTQDGKELETASPLPLGIIPGNVLQGYELKIEGDGKSDSNPLVLSFVNDKGQEVLIEDVSPDEPSSLVSYKVSEHTPAIGDAPESTTVSMRREDGGEDFSYTLQPGQSKPSVVKYGSESWRVLGNFNAENGLCTGDKACFENIGETHKVQRGTYYTKGTIDPTKVVRVEEHDKKRTERSYQGDNTDQLFMRRIIDVDVIDTSKDEDRYVYRTVTGGQVVKHYEQKGETRKYFSLPDGEGGQVQGKTFGLVQQEHSFSTGCDGDDRFCGATNYYIDNGKARAWRDSNGNGKMDAEEFPREEAVDIKEAFKDNPDDLKIAQNINTKRVIGDVLTGKTKVQQGISAGLGLFGTAQRWSGLSRALCGGDLCYGGEIVESIDRWFAGSVLNENYWESLICNDPNLAGPAYRDLQNGDIAYIETPSGSLQPVASIQAERSAEQMQILCEIDDDGEEGCPQGLECSEGFCYDGNEVALGWFYKVTWGVASPADEALTPYINENGIAVSFNIMLNGEEEVRIYSYQGSDDAPVQLVNGDRDSGVITKWSTLDLTQACIDWGQAPITVSQPGIRADTGGSGGRYVQADSNAPIEGSPLTIPNICHDFEGTSRGTVEVINSREGPSDSRSTSEEGFTQNTDW